MAIFNNLTIKISLNDFIVYLTFNHTTTTFYLRHKSKSASIVVVVWLKVVGTLTLEYSLISG